MSEIKKVPLLSDLPLCKKMCGSFGGQRGGGGGAVVAPALPLDRPPTRGMAVAADTQTAAVQSLFP